MNWRARRTGLRLRGRATTRRSRTTTCSSSSFRITSGRTLPATTRRRGTMRPTRVRRPRRRWTSRSKLSETQETAAGLIRRPFLLMRNGFALFEGADGRGFVVPDVEDGVELGDLEQVVDLLGEVEQLEFAARIPDRGEGADQFADAGAIDVADAFQVQQDVL